MALQTGTRLGPYEILGAIGAGGMGEVYRARDTRLERSVAIKILAQGLAGTEEARARFEREARAVSSLNHPHICVLYDVGHQDGLEYLVMEYLEGETLAHRLERGPLPPAEVLELGGQIADALDKAHRQGLVHRDLKPANVMLTKTGAKLLDFGLARSANGDPRSVSLSGATLSRPITVEGTIVGTFQYMAPEQLEGQEADARTDLWALGATLYEMATGKKAFEGASQASLISSIMKDEPRPISELVSITPPALDRVVRQCLAKNPDDRIQSAHDVRLHLKWIAEGGSQAGVPVVVAARRRRRESALIGTVGAAAAVAALAVGWNLTHRPAEPTPIRFQFDPPPAVQVIGSPRVSPDGKIVAFDAIDTTGRSLIWLRRLGALDAQPLPGTDGTSRPFWSPDSRYLGFMAGGKLKKIRVDGGPPIVVCDAPSGSDGSWGKGDVILFDGRNLDPIFRVSAGGGVPVAAVSVDTARGGVSVGWPEFMPDGRHFLYLAASNDKSILRMGEVGSAKSRDIMPCESRTQYVPPGYLLFSRSGTLVAQPFQAGAGKPKGDPFPVAENVQIDVVGGSDFSSSANGVLTYAARGGLVGQIVKLDRAGHKLAQVGTTGDVMMPMLSPDQRRLAVRARDTVSRGRDIWVVDIARGAGSRLTFDKGDENYPVWSPDGQSLLYWSTNETGPGLYVQQATGSGRSEKILESKTEIVPSDWTRDGRFVIFGRTSDVGQTTLIALPMIGDRKPTPLFPGTQGRVSPDGRWIAYTSTEGGNSEVFVQSFPEPGGKWQISTRGGSEAVWRGDGKELFYISADQRLMSVEVAASTSFDYSVPRILFPIRLLVPSGPRNHYAVTADGSAFYAVSPLEGESAGTTAVVVNWPAEHAKR